VREGMVADRGDIDGRGGTTKDRGRDAAECYARLQPPDRRRKTGERE
jgi:hypothetical protein